MDKGFIWGVYNPEESFAVLSVWVIDKGNREDADEWLSKFLNGTHTSSTVEPLRLDHVEVQTLIEFHKEFSECPITIKGAHGYEWIRRLQLENINYRLYYSYGRFVIGGEYMSTMRDADKIRKRFRRSPKLFAFQSNIETGHADSY